MSFQRSLKKMLDDFDANNSAPYATFAPTRSIKWKIHANRRSALNAFSQYDYIILYELENSLWKQLVRKCYLDHEERCENCGGTTVTKGYQGNDVDGGMFGWARDPKKRSKKAEPLELKYVCRNCFPNFL